MLDLKENSTRIEPAPEPTATAEEPEPPAESKSVSDNDEKVDKTPAPKPKKDEPTKVVKVTHVTNVRDWTGIQWLLAVIGAIIALLIASATRGVFGDIDGIARGTLVFFWFVFVTLTGFFGGGLLGTFINPDADDS